MDNDRIFNLQITIQKLEEEVYLYRNGTNANELLELISEKNTEIDALNKSFKKKDQSLQVLVAKTSEVVLKFDRVQIDYDLLQIEHSDLIQEKKELNLRVAQLESRILLSSKQCTEKDLSVHNLEDELHARLLLSSYF